MEGLELLGVDDACADEIGAAVVRRPPPMSTFVPDMRAVGGIPYDGSKGMPNGFVGSYGLFAGTTSRDPGMGDSIVNTNNPLMFLNPIYAASATSGLGPEHYGYVWGSFDRDNVPGGIPYGGRLQEGKWNEIFGRYEPGATGDFNRVATDAEAFASATQKSKHGQPFGPLVGNPSMPDFAKMRVDGQGNMFWFPSEAPKWLARPAVTKVSKGARDAAAIAADLAAHKQNYRSEQARLIAERSASQQAQMEQLAAAEQAAFASEAQARSGIEAQWQDVQAQQAKNEQARANTRQALAAERARIAQLRNSMLGEELDGLDLLGAASTGLASQIITVRVKSIDVPKLKAAIGASPALATLLSGALTFVDANPKAALDAGLPIALGEARKRGIDAEAYTSDAPQYPRRAMSEFWPGLGIGLGVGASALAIAKLIGKIFTK